MSNYGNSSPQLAILLIQSHFTSAEMSMLLDQKDNDVFNSVATMDETHNSVIEMVHLHKEERTKLADLFPRRMENMISNFSASTPERSGWRLGRKWSTSTR